MFDPKTLMSVGLFIPSSFFILLLIEFRWSKKQAVRCNLMANFFYLLSGILFLFKNNLDPFFSFILAYSFLIFSTSFILITTFKLFSIKDLKKRLLIVNLLVFFVLIFFFYIKYNLQVLYFVIYIGLSIIYLLGSLHIIVSTKKKNRELLAVFAVELFFISISSVVRFIHFKIAFDAMEPILPDTHYILASLLFILFWNYSVQLKRNSIFRDELDRNSFEIYQIQEDLSFLIHTYIESCDDCALEELYPHIFDMISGHFKIDYSILFLHDKRLNPVYYIGFTKDEVNLISNANSQVDINNIAYSNMYPEELYVGLLENGDFKSLFLKNNLIGAIAFPLFADRKRLGTLFVGIKSNISIINKDRDIFNSICRQISGVIYSARLHNELIESKAQLSKMASTDPLTGIYNRREFFRRFRSEFSSSVRHSHNFCLFIIDIDDFKNINDTYGHDVGDIVLVKTIHTIKHQLRTSDLIARYGGEEFVGILMKSDKDGAIKKINKIINSISKTRIHNYPKIRITISVGVCFYNQDYENVESMIKKADIELYKAKKSGKNRLSI